MTTPGEREDRAHLESEDSLTAEGHRAEASRASEGSREQDALIFRGQRRVNLLWESTQAAIALLVVGAVVVICIRNAWAGRVVALPEVLQYMVTFIVATYFARTNHEKIGGVGPRPEAGAYRGR